MSGIQNQPALKDFNFEINLSFNINISIFSININIFNISILNIMASC